MPNIELLEKSMPVAPIRIAALEGCRELAEEVDRNLVKFRKELVEKKGLDNIRHKLQFLCDTSILHNCNHVFILFLHIYLHYKSNAICRVSSVPESV